VEHAWGINSEHSMPKKASNSVVRALIGQVHDRIEEASIAANAAEQLAKRGHTEKALRILMDVEGPVFEAQELFRTAMRIKQTFLPD
jgi:hypothetical protein